MLSLAILGSPLHAVIDFVSICMFNCSSVFFRIQSFRAAYAHLEQLMEEQIERCVFDSIWNCLRIVGCQIINQIYERN